MLKARAIWKVGYPSGPDKKIYSGGDVFECDDEWGKRKAEQGKVEIIKEIKEDDKGDKNPETNKESNDKIIDITEMKTRDDFSFVEECEDPEQINKWLEQETKGESRKTILEILNARLEELKE